MKGTQLTVAAQRNNSTVPWYEVEDTTEPRQQTGDSLIMIEPHAMIDLHQMIELLIVTDHLISIARLRMNSKCQDCRKMA